MTLGHDRATFDVAGFAALRQSRGISLGEPLIAVPETGSTNDDALEGARLGAAHGSTYVADAQTHGRGRRGHTWTSPPGQNLTFSVLLRPALAADRVSTLTLVVGLAVRAVVQRRVSSHVAVKWPNDVVIDGRKLGGILVESKLRGSSVEAVVVGVGVNVNMRDMPANIAEIATSLALAGDPLPSRETVLADVLGELETRLDTFARDGLPSLLPELSAHDALFGERIVVGSARGVGAGIDEDGALLVRTDGGAVERVTSGTVERE
jgi:BirA family biotin operon repressor/biotin-[acetyl-CoA-carboxylase] ligase